MLPFKSAIVKSSYTEYILVSKQSAYKHKTSIYAMIKISKIETIVMVKKGF